MKDLIERQAAIDAINTWDKFGVDERCRIVRWHEGLELYVRLRDVLTAIVNLPVAQPDIKQAAKLLSDFIENCSGGDSYLITPDGEELRTDWGYATEGIQLIYDWAERRQP